jgi:hypothetical protein
MLVPLVEAHAFHCISAELGLGKHTAWLFLSDQYEGYTRSPSINAKHDPFLAFPGVVSSSRFTSNRTGGVNVDLAMRYPIFFIIRRKARVAIIWGWGEGNVHCSI